MSAVARYIRHAEHFGVAEVFETAARDRLEVVDLGRLSLRLQNIDPKWSLPHSTRRTFALALHDQGVIPRDICRMSMISRRTLKRALEEVPDVSISAPEPAFQSGGKWTIPAALRNGSRDADLSTSLAADTERAYGQ